MASIRQRTATTTCAVCHRLFDKGDRVVTVFIVQKVGRNMETQDMGAWLGEDFELAHVVCPDPGLEGNLIIPSPGVVRTR